MTVTAHRMIRCRLLSRKVSGYRWLDRVLDDQQQLYNDALEERVDCYRKTGKGLTCYVRAKSLSECRCEFPEMKACSIMIHLGALKRLDKANRAFLRRMIAGSAAGFPKFPGRWRFISIVSDLKVRYDHLHVSVYRRILVPCQGGNPCSDGKLLSAVLKREGSRWFATICCGVKIDKPADNGHAVGGDMNIGQIVGSDGQIHHAPGMRRLDTRIRRCQRIVSKRKNDSGRRRRTVRCLVKRKAPNIRRKWHHNVSIRLANSTGTVVVGDPKTAHMTRSVKGSAEDPGRNVRQKTGLSRTILDTGWASLRQMLEYRSGRVIAVLPHHTSRTCHASGAFDAASRRSQIEFRFVACGHSASADLNMASSMQGIGMTVRGGAGDVRPVKREIDAMAA